MTPADDRPSEQEGLSWDDVAADWDTDPGPRAYAAAAFHSLNDALGARPGRLEESRVLDFGCGTGLLTERLAPRCPAIDAVDSSAAMLAVLQQKISAGGWDHVRALASPPPTPRSYDLIIASSVCAFLDDHPATVRRLATLLRPGGHFIQWDWERDPDDADGHGLTREEIGDALTAAGLTQTAVESAFAIDIEGVSARPLRGIGTAPAA